MSRIAIAACVALVSAAAGCVPSPRAFSVRPTRPDCRVAILPFSNYTPTRDAPDRIGPMLAAELAKVPGVEVVDAGAVEAALAKEPWLLMDRVPPDLVDQIGSELRADAILVGSVLGYGYRDSGGDRIPQLSLSLRLVETPGGRLLWSAVHSRDGADGEWLFGMGRVESLEQLASKTVEEIVDTFPVADVRHDPFDGRSTEVGRP
jgi:TolB-like protein